MGRGQHNPEQIVNILRQIELAIANGKMTPTASREAGITEQTYYRWRTCQLVDRQWGTRRYQPLWPE